ncbi:MAG: NTP transferase domain-containing protein [Chitinispirillaceae bacterium]|nr:NTP transferase domain-containing protein [Chitinispirillaceae bacterium]
MKAVIIAAGRGSRIASLHRDAPKTLLPFRGATILSTIMENIAMAGILDLIIVVGYHADHIRRYIARNECLFACSVRLVENLQWTRGNGISVLASEAAVGGDDFLVSMSDHIVSPSAIGRIAAHPGRRNVLLVDRDIAGNFDLNDATKVLVEKNGAIVGIGKELSVYNALDCGIFRLTPRFYDSMRRQLKDNRESISNAVTGLIKNRDMEALFLEEDEQWFDIDTPEAYAHALKNAAPRAA